VESGSKNEGIITSRGGCSEFTNEVHLSHNVSVRDGARTENNQI
jgi:hypothetical protein